MYRVFTFYKCDLQLLAGQDFLWPCDAIIIINIMVNDHWSWSPYKYQKYSVCRVKKTKNKKKHKNSVKQLPEDSFKLNGASADVGFHHQVKKILTKYFVLNTTG